jgi:hypothetical protein
MQEKKSPREKNEINLGELAGNNWASSIFSKKCPKKKLKVLIPSKFCLFTLI